MQNPIIEQITDNGTNDWTPSTRGRYLIVIGSNSADVAFDSGTVTASQHGITLKDTGGNNVAASAAARFIVDGIVNGEAVTFTTASVAAASANIDISIYKLNPEDLIA